jgi:hypothetical protein
MIHYQLAEKVKARERLSQLQQVMKQPRWKDNAQARGYQKEAEKLIEGNSPPAKAEPLLREYLAISEKNEPNDWRTFNTKSLLGGTLLDQKKYAVAEPLLLTGYEGMKLREAQIPVQRRICLTRAVERLVQIYEATNRYDQAAKWRKKLDRAKVYSKGAPAVAAPGRRSD